MDSETMSLLGICRKSHAKNCLWKNVNMGVQKQPPVVSTKKRCALKNSAKFTGKHLWRTLFKKTPPQVFLKRFCEIFKKTFCPGDRFWKFTSSWLLLMLFRITNLKDSAKFPKRFVRAMEFFSKNFIRNNPITGIF